MDGRLLPQIPFHVCRSARWFLGKLPILLCDQVRSKLVLDVGCMWGGKEASGSRAKQYCMKLERGIEHIAIHFLTGFSRATGLCGPLKSATSPCPSTWRRRRTGYPCRYCNTLHLQPVILWQLTYIPLSYSSWQAPAMLRIPFSRTGSLDISTFRLSTSMPPSTHTHTHTHTPHFSLPTLSLIASFPLCLVTTSSVLVPMCKSFARNTALTTC